MACGHRHIVVHRAGAQHRWEGADEAHCACQPTALCPTCQPRALQGCLVLAGTALFADLSAVAQPPAGTPLH